MKLLLLTCFLAYVITVVNSNEEINCWNDLKGYYWRDYTGDIPSDAFVGGRDAAGNPIYIGQTIYSKVGVVVPGKINAQTKKLYFEFDQTEHPITEDVKILCTIHPEHFKWIGTEGGVKVSTMVKSHEHLIVGGHDRPHPVVIGRRTNDNEVEVGKVLVIHEAFEAIHLTKDGKGWQENSFAVLVYSPPL